MTSSDGLLYLLQALQVMLEQEMWKRLPTPAGRRPNFKAALEGKGESQEAQAFDTSSFACWVAAGNPWKRQESGEACMLQ